MPENAEAEEKGTVRHQISYSEEKPLTLLEEFFPLQTGDYFRYRIRHDRDRYAFYPYNNYWKEKNKKGLMKDIIYYVLPGHSLKYSYLSFLVTDREELDWPVRTNSAFRLRIIEDDLEIYEQAAKIYWVLDPGNYRVLELIFLKSGTFLDPRISGNTDPDYPGFSVRTIFQGKSSLKGPTEKLDTQHPAVIGYGITGDFFIENYYSFQNPENGKDEIYKQIIKFEPGRGLNEIIQLNGDNVYVMHWRRVK